MSTPTPCAVTQDSNSDVQATACVVRMVMMMMMMMMIVRCKYI